VRKALKSFFEQLLLRGGPATLARRRFAGRSLVLAYHNVVPDECEGRGDASLHLSLSSFRAQLDALAEHAEVLSLAELLAAPRSSTRSGSKPRVSITFDDAYAGAVMLAVPEVVRRGMSATLFVSPGRLGGDAFWWDLYAQAQADAGRDGFRELALRRLRGSDEEVGAWAGGQGWQRDSLPSQLCTADESRLAEVALSAGVTVASHSWSHPNLTRLEDDELADELSRPLEWLRTCFAGAPSWIAYPYGLADRRVAAAAKNAGYDVGFRVEGGWLSADGGDDPLMLPRLNIPAGLSDAGFRLRLAGLR